MFFWNIFWSKIKKLYIADYADRIIAEYHIEYNKDLQIQTNEYKQLSKPTILGHKAKKIPWITKKV